jgi:hypothetical protein
VSGKSEARALRKAKKAAEEAEKSARLKERPGVGRVRADAAGDPGKQTRRRADPGSIYTMQMTWTLDKADRDESWSWGPRNWSQETWDGELLPKLKAFEALRWAEIDQAFTGTADKRRRLHHDMPTEQLVQEAQTRLVEIGEYDETVFRFRLGGKQRLWGKRIVAEFRIIWYDPDHRIYPVD